jgi:hypothetical protein
LRGGLARVRGSVPEAGGSRNQATAHKTLEQRRITGLQSEVKDHEQINVMKRQIILALLGAVLVAGLTTGCNTVWVQSKQFLGVANYPPTDPASIQVLQTQPTTAHVRLGEVTLQPQGHPSKADMEKKLRLAASKMGANAVVIVADQTMVFGTTVMGPWWSQTAYPDVGRVIVGVAIRYTQ